MIQADDHNLSPEGPEDGHLSPLRLEALRLSQGTDFEYAHLRGCAQCRDGLALQRRLAHDLAPAADPPFAIPDERRRQILANTQRRLVQPPLRSILSSARRAWVPLALAATLLIGVAIGRWMGGPKPADVASSTGSDRAGLASRPDGEAPRPGHAGEHAARTGSRVEPRGSAGPGTVDPVQQGRSSSTTAEVPHGTRLDAADHGLPGGAPRDLDPSPPSGWSRQRAVVADRQVPSIPAPTPNSALQPTGERADPDAGRTGSTPQAPAEEATRQRPTTPSTATARTSPYSSAAHTTIKLATILPDGAPGTSELKSAADVIRHASADRVEIKLYLGVSGDEKDIVKKLEIGQLQAAHLTGLGLAEILPSIHVLDLPFLLSSYEQVDHVYEKLFSYFQSAFRERGFEFLGFTETGFVYVYSNLKIDSLETLRKAKIWAAEGDPLTDAFAREASLQTVPLGIPDVLQSLQTGLIDTVYGPPSGMIGLQWFTRVAFVQSVPFVHATGGIVMATRAFDALSPDLQSAVSKAMAEQAAIITRSLRQANDVSKAEITKAGVEQLPKPNDEFWKQVQDISDRVAEHQCDVIYPKFLLERVRALRDEAGLRQPTR